MPIEIQSNTSGSEKVQLDPLGGIHAISIHSRSIPFIKTLVFPKHVRSPDVPKVSVATTAPESPVGSAKPARTAPACKRSTLEPWCLQAGLAPGVPRLVPVFGSVPMDKNGALIQKL